MNKVDIKCKICNNPVEFFDKALILNKHNVNYYLCKNCNFLQTEEPYWLHESYSKVFSTYDTGTMSRNMTNTINLLFFLKFIPRGINLDFGGGYGVLTRMMRDYGFDFYHYDKYAENLFAYGFDGDLKKKYNLITSFENFEHFVNPIEEIEKIINSTEYLYFTTLLLPNPIPRINDWWYYSTNSGQHISFYSLKTLKYIAKRFNMHLTSDNAITHILSKKKITPGFFYLLKLYNKIHNLTNLTRYFKHKSKTWADREKMVKQKSQAVLINAP
jgi:hypothetical protein